tara:strand:+ start:425 stop:598 length:174 start_codon:yes stop_codon:yes gene_type:complete
MANDKSVNKKRSISARVDMAVYKKMLEVAKDPNHKYYDRKVAYIVNKLLLDWLTKEK